MISPTRTSRAPRALASFASSAPLASLASLSLALASGCSCAPSPGAPDGALDPAADGAIAALDGGSAPLAWSEFVRARARAECESVEACYGPFENDPWRVPCADLPPIDPDEPDDDGLLPGGHARYDASRARACLDALAADPCHAWDRIQVGCEGAVIGLVAEGGACTRNDECATGLGCARDDAGVARCAPRGEVGDPCSSLCRSELVCDNATETCIEPARLGERCDDRPCSLELVCLGELGGPRACRERAASRTATEGEECVSALCAPGLLCTWREDTRTGAPPVCLARSEPGGTCYPGAYIDDPCPVGEYCDSTALSYPGTCRPVPQADEPCAGSRCAPGLMCVLDVCRDVHDSGEPCAVDADCDARLCLDGACL